MADTPAAAPAAPKSPAKKAVKKATKPKVAPKHPGFNAMVVEAIAALKERTGSSLAGEYTSCTHTRALQVLTRRHSIPRQPVCYA